MEIGDRCIVSVGFDGNYGRVGIPRLAHSLYDVGEAAPFLFYQDCEPPDAPSNKDVPRGFKLTALQSAIDSGFKTLLWCDATVCWEKPLDPVWRRIEEEGYFFTEWSNTITDIGNPEAFAKLGEDFEACKPEKIPTILAGLWGFTLNMPIGRAVWHFMCMAMKIGAFMEPDGRDEVPMSLMVKRWGLRSDPDPETNWFTSRQVRNPNRLAWFEGV